MNPPIKKPSNGTPRNAAQLMRALEREPMEAWRWADKLTDNNWNRKRNARIGAGARPTQRPTAPNERRTTLARSLAPACAHTHTRARMRERPVARLHDDHMQQRTHASPIEGQQEARRRHKKQHESAWADASEAHADDHCDAKRSYQRGHRPTRADPTRRDKDVTRQAQTGRGIGRRLH